MSDATNLGALMGYMAGMEMRKKKEAKEKAETEAILKAMQQHKNQAPRPGSAAHYEAWRKERMKKAGKE